jgi:SPP1 gp7 family putative phage head morphogenesis protein
MDRESNSRLRELDRRLRQTYKAAELTAIQRLQKAESKLAEFQLMPDVLPAYQAQAAQMHLLRVDRETRLLQNIANDLSRSGEIAGQMISGESLNIFQNGYGAANNELRSQIGNMNISASWGELDRNSLNALYNGRDTQLGNLPGYQAGFEQVQSRQVWQRNLVGDRRRGAYYYERALGNLGNNTEIVRLLQNQLGQALLLGESIPQIATRIRAVTQGCRMQAVRIARTECMRALNQGKMLCYYEAQGMGIPLKKKWISTSDDRTRESHSYMDGETVELDEAFSNGLMYPLDPNGPPEETIHCRCIVVSIVQYGVEEIVDKYQDQKDHLKGLMDEEHFDAIESIVDGADERAQEFFWKHTQSLDSIDGGNSGTYNFDTKKMTVDLNADANGRKGEYNVFFHEKGHHIDNMLGTGGKAGAISDDAGFHKALNSDFQRMIIRETYESKRIGLEGIYTRESLDPAILDIIRTNPNTSVTVQDVIAGMSYGGNITGRDVAIANFYKHDDRYWVKFGTDNKAQTVASEAFAGMTAGLFDKNHADMFELLMPDSWTYFTNNYVGLGG